LESAIIIALLVGLAWSIDGLLFKKFDKSFGMLYSSLAITSLNFTVSIIAFPFFYAGYLNINVIFMGLIAGILSGIGYLLFFTSLKSEQASNTFALMELQVIVLILFGALVLSEKISYISLLGILLIILGVLAVLYTKELKLNRRLIPAMLANIIWGVSWIFFFYSYKFENGIPYAMIINFGTALLVVAFYLIINKVKKYNSGNLGTLNIKADNRYKYNAGYDRNIKKLNKKGDNKKYIIYLGIIAGLLSGIGNVGFSFLESINKVAIGSAISNMQPIFIAIIAYFIYKEKLSKLQSLGIIIAVLGAVAVALF